ncbi:DUF4169 family protein [Sphingomonas solaris]|uniref:DUF4169 family protein n=1 Tax=Alterirhizorhabdus solaris TaxID=2529389 RepID=A0A558R3V4_9SPHN|nr:DUF4169 family protein [Sphingomonas solaris]TVV74060.1 DUF4169 family protein [Sphingomonas solaris]
MGDIINLRQARKQRARDGARVQAAANRALHGRTKAEKAAEAKDQDRQQRLLDGAAIDRGIEDD